MFFAIEFCLRRVTQGIVIVFLVAFLVFSLLRIIPGDPVRLMLGPMTTPAVMEQTARDLGLRDPIYVQFVRYLRNMLSGDLGTSFIRGKQGGSTAGSRGDTTHDPENRASVAGLIATALPYSILLAGLGITFAVMFSFPLGIVAGLCAGKWPDRVAVYLSSILVSLPNIWLAIVFIFLFSAKLGWLPAIGYKGPEYAILPALVIALELTPILVRSVSVSVANSLNENYVDVGLVRGVPRRTMVRHVLRNASIPILNVFGVQVIGMLLGGLFVVEFIFSYPGFGLMTINAVFQRDFPVVQAVAVLSSGVLVSVNMLVDFVATNIDRRLQY
jgi:ABC-type dipeptide/oligopeptide/nickel transport system permease component